MGEQILPLALTVSAETIRKEIRNMIPESEQRKPGKAERLPTSIKGGVMYGGSDLAKKVSELIKEMKIGQVCKLPYAFFLCSYKDSGSGLWRNFTKPRKFSMTRFRCISSRCLKI
jgi:hypothetical protein